MIRSYLELIRFSHTLFALPFALLSASMGFYSQQAPRRIFWPLFGVLFCMIFARSAAMSFNRWADQKIDALNPRTSERHIPRGEISSRAVLLFTGLCSLGFVGSCCLFLPSNPIPILFSVPVLVFLFLYSFAKRWTIGSHLWLGVSLMLAPIAAWIAIHPVFSWAPILLAAAVLFWSAGFDIIYATQDYDFDVKMRLKSVPARFGIPKALRIATGFHLISLVFLFLLPLYFPAFGKIYYVGMLGIAAVLISEHVVIRPGKKSKEIDLSKINLAFFHLNAIISLGLLGIGLLDLVF